MCSPCPQAGGPITLNVILLDAHHCLVRAGGNIRVTTRHLPDTGIAHECNSQCTVLSAPIQARPPSTP